MGGGESLATPKTKGFPAIDFDNSIQIQSLLMNVEPSTLDVTKLVLFSPNIPITIDIINKYINELYIAVERKPLSIPYLSKLLKYINDSISDEQVRSIIQDRLINFTLDSRISDEYDPLLNSRLLFLKHATNDGIISERSVLLAIYSLWRMKRNCKAHLSVIFCWFMKEIYNSEVTYFKSFFRLFIHTRNSQILSKHFTESVDIENHCFLQTKKELLNQVEHDDPSKLNQIDPNLVVSSPVYEGIAILQSNLPILSYAAYFNASRCIQVLLNRGADPHMRDENELEPACFAVAGDSIKALKLLPIDRCQQKCIEIAIKQRNFHMYQYIASFKKTTVTDELIIQSDFVRIFRVFTNPELLLLAAKNGCVNALHYLVQKCNYDINYQNKNGETSLHVAAQNNNEEFVRNVLLYPNVDPNIIDVNQRTPLHISAIKSNQRISEYLINHPKINPNQLDNEGESPLHYAVRNDNLDLIKLLLDSPKVDPNLRNSYCEAPLLLAVRNIGWTGTHLLMNVSDYISNDNEKIDSFIRKQNRTIFKEVILAFLNREDVDVNVTDEIGNTPLHIVARFGHIEFADPFFQRPDLKLLTNKMGKTFIHIAAENGRYAFVNAMLAKPQVDPNVVDMNEQNPMHRAAFVGSGEVLHYLVPYQSIDINARDKWGRTPLLISAVKGKITGIRSLAPEPRTDLFATDKWGCDATHYSSIYKHNYCHTLLILAEDKQKELIKKRQEMKKNEDSESSS